MEANDLAIIITAVASLISTVIGAIALAYISVLRAKVDTTQKQVARVEVATNSMRDLGLKLASADSFNRGVAAAGDPDPQSVPVARAKMEAEGLQRATDTREAADAAAGNVKGTSTITVTGPTVKNDP